MATQIDSLSQIYARSVFELAQQAGGQEKIVEVGDELEQVCELARGDRSFGEFLRSPIVEKTARATSLSSIFSDKVTDLTLRFLLVLNDKGRLARLEQITAAYDSLVQESFGRIEVDVFTPSQLGTAEIERIKAKVQQVMGKEPVLYPYTDPHMIGGIKMRIGDQLIDASVATRLRRMRDQLLSGGATLREHLPAADDEGNTD